MPKSDTMEIRVGTRPQPDFFVFTNDLQVKHPDDAERPTVLCTASSNAIDLEGDRFTKDALKQMEQGFTGKLIFLNHRYSVPTDVFGQVTKAVLTNREGRTDLDLEIVVNTDNPLAVTTYQMICNGMRLGVSVGVLVREVNKTDEESEFGRVVEITDIIPLEASIVGIPANQTAWTQEAIKSLFDDGRLDLDDEEITARAWLTTETAHTDTNRWTALKTVGKGAVGGHSPAKAQQDKPWSGSQAVKRLRSWAGGPAKDKINWKKYGTGFTWINSDAADSFGSYKMPHHDITNGSFVVVFRGAVAAAVVLQGGRGGVNIPEGDVGGCKSHIARHYHQFSEKAPWERGKEDGWLDIELEVADDLMALGLIDELPAFEATFETKSTRVWVTEDGEAREVVVEITDDAAEVEMTTQDAPTAVVKTDEEEQQAAAEEAAENADVTTQAGEAEGAGDHGDGGAAAAEAAGGSTVTGDDADNAIGGPEKEIVPEPEKATAPEEKDSLKGDFEEDVNADLAADTLIDKQFSGFRVLINNLIDILLNTDMSVEDRRKAGSDIISEYQDFVEGTWNETLDSLDTSGKSAPADATLVKARVGAQLLAFIALADGLEVDGGKVLAQAVEQVKGLTEDIAKLAQENKTLKEENERHVAAFAQVDKVLEAIGDMSLGAVTTSKEAFAESLAELFPMLHPDIRERMARSTKS